MTKRGSRSLFAIFTIILVICLVACFVNFTYPFSIGGNYYSYSNFVSNLKLGQDISENLRFVYRAELREGETEENYDALRNDTINSLKDIVTKEGYRDVTVTQYGEDGIIVNVGDLLTRDDVVSLENLIGSPATISFSMTDNVSESFADAKYVKDVTSGSQYNNATGETIFYVLIEFKDEYKDLVAEKTKDGGTLYIYLGEEQFSSIDLNGSAIENGFISIQLGGSDEYRPTITDADNYANRIRTGILSLELVELDCAVQTATYGVGANILLSIAMALFVLLAFIFLIVKYKDAGWLACFNLLFFIVIGLFLLQSIPIANINFAGIIGIMIAFMVAVDSIMNILEKAKTHYNADTKLFISFRLAQKECLVRTFISNGLLILVGLISIFMPIVSLQSLGWALLVLPFVTLFTTLALMRLFIKMYLAFNNENGKKLNFHKGGKNA